MGNCTHQYTLSDSGSYRSKKSKPNIATHVQIFGNDSTNYEHLQRKTHVLTRGCLLDLSSFKIGLSLSFYVYSSKISSNNGQMDPTPIFRKYLKLQIIWWICPLKYDSKSIPQLVCFIFSHRHNCRNLFVCLLCVMLVCLTMCQHVYSLSVSTYVYS
jgi:hypothetical protein